jgi:anti-anti-sigma regulatory factor
MSGARLPSSPRVVLPEDLSVRSWRSCADSASVAVESAHVLLVVECSGLRTFDEHGVAMLVGLAHYSARQQVRVMLANPPAGLRQHLELAGLAWFFEWRPLVDGRPADAATP